MLTRIFLISLLFILPVSCSIDKQKESYTPKDQYDEKVFICYFNDVRHIPSRHVAIWGDGVPMVEVDYCHQERVLYIDATLNPCKSIEVGNEYLRSIEFSIPLDKVSDTNEVCLGPDEVILWAYQQLNERKKDYQPEVISALLKFDMSFDQWVDRGSYATMYVSGTFTIDYTDSNESPRHIDRGVFKFWITNHSK